MTETLMRLRAMQEELDEQMRVEMARQYPLGSEISVKLQRNHPQPSRARVLAHQASGWMRVMGEPLPAEGPGSGNKERKDRSEHGGIPVSHQNQAFGVPWQPSVPVTIGWTPSCDCSTRFSCADVCVLQPVPAVVFDPFIGTGTVATVATRLGRHYLGCDLDTKNEQLQHDRLAGQTMGLALA